MHKKPKKRRLLLRGLLLGLGGLSLFVFYQFHQDIEAARQRLASYPVQTFQSSQGKVAYLQRGATNGPAVLLSHGLFGGFDQGAASLESLLGDHYQQIAIARFGYLGSDLPEEASPATQADVYAELLSELGIEQTFIIGTSAGGASAIQFALKYPERTAGLVLLSSGAPDRTMAGKELADIGMTGPPDAFIHDFPVWLTVKYFPFIYNQMFGSQTADSNLMETMLPVAERRPGILNDSQLTNPDILINYDAYPLEELQVPILVLHAEDDPMASYANIAQALEHMSAETAIYSTGGHLLEGHDAGQVIEEFIEKHH